MQTILFLLVLVLLNLTRAVPIPSPVDLEKRVTHSGQMTFYSPSAGEGHCGYFDHDNDLVVALSTERYGNGGNCNQWVAINHGGKTHWGKVRDSCVGCQEYDLDLSPALFQKMAPLSVGRTSMTWHFEAKGFTPPRQ